MGNCKKFGSVRFVNSGIELNLVKLRDILTVHIIN
jgi:hypothetical protein